MIEIREVVFKAKDGREWHLTDDIVTDIEISELRNGGGMMDIMLHFESTEIYRSYGKDLVEALNDRTDNKSNSRP